MSSLFASSSFFLEDKVSSTWSFVEFGMNLQQQWKESLYSELLGSAIWIHILPFSSIWSIISFVKLISHETCCIYLFIIYYLLLLLSLFFLHLVWTSTQLNPFPFAAFLFKHANAQQFGRRKGELQEEGEDKEYLISRYRMAMLTSWLPLLCRASNGADAPTLSGREKAEMVKVLEEMIEKLSWQQQEEVLSLWLHHFTSCPDSDWPNLETCYTRWYSQSRDLLLKRLEL